MDAKISVTEEEMLLLKELDKGIDDMENGRTTPHEETMKILRHLLIRQVALFLQLQLPHRPRRL